MKYRNFVCLVLALAGCFGSIFGQAKPAGNEIYEHLYISAELVKSTKNEIRYSLSIRNRGPHSVYYAANSVDVNGISTPFFSTDENDPALAHVQWRVFDPEFILPLENGGVNDIGIELKRLEPGASAIIAVSIKFPIRQTVPPLDMSQRSAAIFGHKFIDRVSVEKIQFTVAYFEADPGIAEFLTRKPFGWFIVGNERFDIGPAKGKNFFEVQKLVSFEVRMPKVDRRTHSAFGSRKYERRRLHVELEGHSGHAQITESSSDTCFQV